MARKEREAKYRRMQQRPSELRARLLEDKKRLLGEVMEEVELEAPPHPVYIHPVQEEQDQAKVVFSLKDLIERKKKTE